MQGLADEHPELVVKFSKGFRDLEEIYDRPKIEFRPKKVYLLYGKPGTGKTKWAVTYYPDICFLCPASRQGWCDGLDSRAKVVLIDDYGINDQYPRQQLLRMLDGYPSRVPIKGGFRWWNPETVVITSNYTPEELFADPTTCEAFKRRCTGIFEFYDLMAYRVIHGVSP